MMAVEAVKEKFYCFLGIVHPTYYQSRGWGPWLHLIQCIVSGINDLTEPIGKQKMAMAMPIGVKLSSVSAPQ